MLNANEFDGVLILLEAATDEQLYEILKQARDMWLDRINR
jgi:hypothetical protein